MTSPFPPKTLDCCRGHKKKCFARVSAGECDLWVNVKGENPQNILEPIDQWGCVDKFAHLLQIALIAQARATVAEVEKLRTELIGRIDNPRRLAAPDTEPQALEDKSQ